MDYSDIEVLEYLEDENSTSFVGIFRKNGKNYFQLPRGFKKPLTGADSYESTRDLHILFYKLIRGYVKTHAAHKYLAEVNRLRTSKTRPSWNDGAKGEKGDLWLADYPSDDESVIYYRHFDCFDPIIEYLSEFSFLSCVKKISSADRNLIDLRNFVKEDGQRIYNNDGSFYDANFKALATATRYITTDLVLLFCFLADDVMSVVGEYRHSSEVLRSNAAIFKAKYLRSDSASCWHPHNAAQTRDDLREVFHSIEKSYSPPTEEYKLIRDCVERFLYPENDIPEEGEIWGVSHFWPIWEHLVLSRIVDQYRDGDFDLVMIDPTNISSEDIDFLGGQDFLFENYSNGKKSILYNKKYQGLFSDFSTSATISRHFLPDALIAPRRHPIDIKEDGDSKFTVSSTFGPLGQTARDGNSSLKLKLIFDNKNLQPYSGFEFSPFTNAFKPDEQAYANNEYQLLDFKRYQQFLSFDLSSVLFDLHQELIKRGSIEEANITKHIARTVSAFPFERANFIFVDAKYKEIRVDFKPETFEGLDDLYRQLAYQRSLPEASRSLLIAPSVVHLIPESGNSDDKYIDEYIDCALRKHFFDLHSSKYESSFLYKPNTAYSFGRVRIYCSILEELIESNLSIELRTGFSPMNGIGFPQKYMVEIYLPKARELIRKAWRDKLVNHQRSECGTKIGSHSRLSWSNTIYAQQFDIEESIRKVSK